MTAHPAPERGPTGSPGLRPALEEIWRETLGLAAVGVDDDFFEVGGDSLGAVRMLAEVEGSLGTSVSFVDFVETPTLSALAGLVERSRVQVRTKGDSAPATPAGTGPAPCSFAQERLWFVEKLTGASSVYNVSVGARVRGRLDELALERALHEIVRRHSALRTTIAVEGGRPVQVVSDDVHVPLERRDLRGTADADPEAHRLVDAFVTLPFDLEEGPLVRAQLLQLGDNDRVLQLVFHHVVADGWSNAVVFKELGELYRAYSRADDAVLPEPAVQYGDHARAERARLSGNALEEVLEHWRGRLEGIPAALELPTDRPRPPVPTYHGATRRVKLPPDLVTRIRAAGRESGATPFATLLAAFSVVLYRHTNQETVVVGATTSGRDTAQVQDAVGLYARTVALRSDLHGDMTFAELLRRTRDVVMDALANDEAPFEELVAGLQTERDLSRHPVFQAFCAHVPATPLDIPGAEPFTASPRSARVDLTLFIEEHGEDLELAWEYSTDLFDEPTIERLGEQVLRALEAALANPSLTVDSLPLLDQTERRRLLETWNSTDAPYPERPLHALFEEQVRRTPNATALTYEGTSLSYEQLNEQADTVAALVRSRGIGAGQLVAICMERSLELVVGLLAILKAGGAYVPLDPEYPHDRLAFMLEDCGAPLVLTQQSLLPRLPDSLAKPICLDAGVAVPGLGTPSIRLDDGDGDMRECLDELAYVIYTSGSTGKPKGAMNTHRGIVNRLWWMQQAFRLTERDTVLQKTPSSFDVSVWEFFWPLLTGARLVLARPGGHRDPGYLSEIVETERVTTMHFVPSMLQQFVELADAARCRSLRRVICSGEALPGELVARFFERFDCELHNLYGPTEAAVDVTWWPCRRTGEPPVVPIGRPIANTQLYVLDRRGEPSPVGVPGELYIGGIQVARGYLKRPELTTQRFVPNPFSAGLLYRTGDLARWSADGVLEFLGRLDDQVKIRGFRIELGEIEALLSTHEGVAENAVVASEFAPGDMRLAAYVVPHPEAIDKQAFERELWNLLEEQLPPFMVPSTLTFLEALPLTPNGKLDRRSLPRDSGHRRTLQPFVEPRSPTERALAEVWADVLELEHVGIHDSFFDLGGHSLLVARVALRVQEQFGIVVPLGNLFERPTIAALAERIDAGRAEATARPKSVRGQGGERHDSYPLSSAQEQLWFFDKLAPGSATYNAAFAVSISGRLDLGTIERALEAVVARHEALHTVLVTTSDGPRQRVLESWGFALELVDFVEDDRGRELGLRTLLRELARRPFDLAHDLLFRATVIRIEADEHVLLFQSHHVVFDGWSVDLFFADLTELYAALQERRAPRLPELELQYGDFTAWQRARLTGEAIDEELAYWRAQLAGAPQVLALPLDRPRPPRQTFDGASFELELPKDLAEGVLELARSHEATPYMVLLAIFGAMLYRVTGQDDFVVGTPIANRTRTEFERLVGFFANTAALRMRLTGNPSFAQFLARVRETALEAYDHQEIPFGLVVDAVQAQRDPGLNPLFQVNFRVRSGPLSALELRGATTRRMPVDLGLARFDLAFELHLHEEGIFIEAIYNTRLFDQTTIERLSSDFHELLVQVLAEPEARLLSLAVSGATPASAATDSPRIRRFRNASRQPS